MREKPIAQIAKDLGIAESGLRRWMAQADIDEGKKEGLTSDERAELVRLRRENRAQEMEIEILKRASGLLRPGERAPKIGFRLVRELAADGFPVAVACRVLKVSTSGYYEWLEPATVGARPRRCLSARHDHRGPRRGPGDLRGAAGARRAASWAARTAVGRKRVARLMRCTAWPGSTGAAGAGTSPPRRSGPTT